AGHPLDNTLSQIDALRDRTEQELAGKRLQTLREQTLSELNRLEAQRIKALQEEAAATKASFRQQLGIDYLKATGQDQAAADAEFYAEQTKKVTDALKQFGLSDLTLL